MNLEQLKSSSENYLRKKNIDVASHLPTIEPLSEVRPRSAADIASRAFALSYFIRSAYGVDRKVLTKDLKNYGLWEHVTKSEKDALSARLNPNERKADISWTAESIQALAWCLELVAMDHFRHCDDDLAEKFPVKTDPSEFISQAKIKPIEEIQRQCDLLYRMHSFARQARFEGKACPFEEVLVCKRRHAMDWVYGVKENWDEIPLDT